MSNQIGNSAAILPSTRNIISISNLHDSTETLPQPSSSNIRNTINPMWNGYLTNHNLPSTDVLCSGGDFGSVSDDWWESLNGLFHKLEKNPDFLRGNKDLIISYLNSYKLAIPQDAPLLDTWIEKINNY